jgi:hypothetical protein
MLISQSINQTYTKKSYLKLDYDRSSVTEKTQSNKLEAKTLNLVSTIGLPPANMDVSIHLFPANTDSTTDLLPANNEGTTALL